MRFISNSKTSRDVSSALDKLIKEVNEKLKSVDGVITKLECDVSAGPAGASVSVSLTVNGSEPRRKELVGVNEKGVSREHAMKNATEKLNKIIATKDGELADFFVKTIITPIPGRVYTTIVAAVNEVILEEAQNIEMRRQRLKKTLELLNNDPSAINVTGVAEVFGVSRTIIYKDLEALGFKRKTLSQ
jgi:transcriptional regulator of NAD metabolism